MELYKDSTKSPRERAADLLSRMTLDEKLAQMLLRSGITRNFDEKAFAAEYPHGIGASYDTGDVDADGINRMQRHLVENTRLGIPMLMATESVHGFMCKGATNFPQALGLGATWNPELISQIAGVIAREARAHGVTQTFSPDLDLARDPRWGRVEETYGEDTYLTTRLGVEYVRAARKRGLACTPKHYVAHGSPESGINLGPVHAGERELRDTMLPPFAAAIKEGGALAIMPAYSELDGEPLHSSRFLLTTLLREELGFEGYVVSDFGAVEMLHSFHHVAADPVEAGVLALNAGMDMEAPAPFGFGEEFRQAAREGKIDLAQIDQAVERILFVKFSLGLFENPYAVPNPAKLTHTPESVALSRRAAEESAVLLKNEGLLPLSENVGTIALIGPSAVQTQVGGYSPRNAAAEAVTLRQALSERLGEEKVRWAKGCSYANATDEEIDQAVEAAKNADIAVMVLGDNSNFWAGVGWGDESGLGGSAAVTCGEGFDMHELKLPGRQQELLEKVYATGTPVVLLLMTGRPYCIGWAKEHIPAILQTWYPGEQGGYALSNLLFGDVNPSGKLPISFPQSAGHLPCFYNKKVSARGTFYRKPGSPDSPGRDYVFATPDALYPFGYGLSYTTFEYSDLMVTPERTAANGAVEVSVMVTNTGERAGKEVVQLYLRDLVSRITPYIRRLRGFEKIWLEPGESKRVTFSLDTKDFEFINEKMQPEVEPGEFAVYVDKLEARFWVE